MNCSWPTTVAARPVIGGFGARYGRQDEQRLRLVFREQRLAVELDRVDLGVDHDFVVLEAPRRPTPWNLRLSAAMAKVGVAVNENAILDALFGRGRCDLGLMACIRDDFE